MKNWKVKEEGGLDLFGITKEKFNTKDEAMNFIKDNLPRRGIFSQAVHHKLFERIGLRWKLVGCYIRDAKYVTEKEEDVAIPLEKIVLACEHVKKNLDELEKKGNKTCNQMFGIRANYLKIFCKKNCEINAFRN